MSTHRSVPFYETLVKYVWQYIEARGNSATCVQFLKDCQKDIAESLLHKKQDIELPENLCQVSTVFHFTELHMHIFTTNY